LRFADYEAPPPVVEAIAPEKQPLGPESNM
jgi:hypothetical protein